MQTGYTGRLGGLPEDETNMVSRYYVVGKEGALKPVNINVREGLIIPPEDKKLLPEPLEIKQQERVNDTSKLPVGSIVEEREDGWFYQLIVREHRNIDIAKEGGVLDFFEKQMVDRIREAYGQRFSVPSDAKRTPLYSLLSQDVTRDIIEGVRWIPQEDANILLEILVDMRENGMITNQIERKLAKELTKAVKDKQRP